MAYTLKVPKLMHIFERTGPRSALLGRTGATFTTGEKIKIAGMEIMSYDHRDQLVLKLADEELLKSPDEDQYLLVGEIQDAMEKANEWSYASSSEARQAIQQEIAPLLRRHIQPDLQVVGDKPMAEFEKEGPGVRHVALL